MNRPVSHKLPTRRTAFAGAAICLLVLALPPAFGWANTDLDFGDLISASGFIITVLILFVSVVPSVDSLAKTANSAHYAQLDTMYLDILKLGIDKPYLIHRGKMTPARLPEYDGYAYVVWNFIETVRDRCADDDDLKSIWGPVIAFECALHRDWFNEETLHYRANPLPKFRVEFVDFIWRCFGGPDGPICGNALDRSRGGWINGSWECRPRHVIEADPDPRIREWLGTDPIHPVR
jgi:hypothetical protein